MLSILKSPITFWLKWVIDKISWKFKNPSLKLEYLAWCKNSKFGVNVSLLKNSIVKNSEIDNMTYVGANTNINNSKIGKFCSIGPGCRIGPGQHPTDTFVSTHPAFYSTNIYNRIGFADKQYFEEYKKIYIGNDVWLGANVIIVDGINIGDGAMVAAGAIVTKDVPPYAIVGGIPAKILKYRFEDEEIKFLLKEKWWNRDFSWMKNNQKLFLDIKSYIKNI